MHGKLGQTPAWTLGLAVAFVLFGAVNVRAQSTSRPNILIAIADDQSFPHMSAYGDPAVQTPSFDQVAADGVLFRNAFTPAPGCSPMRAAFLSGREIWQLGPAGTHASSFPRDIPVFPEQLSNAGYHVGMTGKGWGPGNYKLDGWPHNPAGKSWSGRTWKSPKGVSSNDYAANFEDFLGDREADKPFCFWFGAHEPHRGYEYGNGRAHGVDPDKVAVPRFLPDSETVRNDIADYLFEIETFDAQLGRMLKKLDEIGERENTLVIVTSDNGMPFPRAKANLYEYGIHMPLAICWPTKFVGSQTVDDLVSLIDVTKTIYAAAGVAPKSSELMPGYSLMSRMCPDGKGAPVSRKAVFSGRERHSSSRYHSLGYPCRAIRTADYLYIANYTPRRWPAGPGQKYDGAKFDAENHLVSGKLGSPHAGYHDIDDGPTLRWMISNRADPSVAPLLSAAVDRRPAAELYDITRDPACLNNLALIPEHQDARQSLEGQLADYQRLTRDLRLTSPGKAHVWETYQRFSSLRWFAPPDWVQEITDATPVAGKVPTQPWLEDRRPRVKSTSN